MGALPTDPTPPTPGVVRRNPARAASAGPRSPRWWRALLVLLPLVLAPAAGLAQPLAQPGAAPAAVDPLAGAPTGLDPARLPAALVPWIDWVLDGEDPRACPVAASGERVCAWPGRLTLALDADGGRFEQDWQLAAPGWVGLPGDDRAWPQQVVEQSGAAVAVVARDGAPAVYLDAGRHRLRGAFVWPRRPDGLTLPASTGLLALVLDGVPVANPRIDADRRLWLGAGDPAAATDTARQDRLDLEVTRLIDDDLPLRVVTRLHLDVAGVAREVRLGPVGLPGGIPLAIDSPLPARLEADGRLVVQVRPGRFELLLTSQHPAPVDALALPARPAPWPAAEVWALRAHPDLRQVEPGGAVAVDPSQTRLPAEWQRLPAYRLQAGETLTLTTVQRGASGTDRLTLARTLWLDFDGGGFSARDLLRGDMQQGSRLAVEPVLTLGRAEVQGEPRLLTRLATTGDDGEAAAVGFEVPRGDLRVTADGRIDAVRSGLVTELPASGWTLTLERAETALHLPAGWDLLAVQGADNLPPSWLARWSLLDLFLVLITALAVARLWGWPWGLLALAALALTWSEPGAPRATWLVVLAAVALLRVLPTAATRPWLSWLRRLVRVGYVAALLLLAVILLPFLVTEMRDGLFPQLDHSGAFAAGATGAGVATMAADEPAADAMFETPASAPAPAPASEPAPPRKEGIYYDRLPGSSLSAPAAEPLPTLDPGARIQTGAGVPSWRGARFELLRQGPVAPGERLRLWLLPPAAALPLALLRVVLVLALALKLGGLLASRAGRAAAGGGATGLPVLAILAVAGLAGPSAPAVAQPAPAAPAGTDSGWPTPELLTTLRERLLRAPECLPACASIARLTVGIDADGLALGLDVDAATAAALPIPGGADAWQPAVITLDGAPLDALERAADGSLRVPVAAGRHRLDLRGPVPAGDQIELPLPLRPYQVRAELPAGWRLEGVDAGGRPGEQIRLVHDAPRAAASDGDGAGQLPPLLRVRRLLRLGLDWDVQTEVERLSPAAVPVSIGVPLLPGESVTSAEREVIDGRVLVSLPPGRTGDGWQGRLAPVAHLRLTASDDPRLTEEWQVELSPIWHLTASGVPQVQTLDASGPLTWRPWPGETLDLAVVRPSAVPGPTLTRDASTLVVTPGRRGSEATLTLRLRASQGTRHDLALPDGAEATALRIDGATRPLAVSGGRIDLPIVPGAQRIELDWRDPRAIGTWYRAAPVAIGLPGVDAETVLIPAADRWVLWTTGPGQGPAVLFWGLLALLVIVAALLARLAPTPLGFLDWLLLGIGLSQVSAGTALVIPLWLIALGLRRRLGEQTPRWQFNLVQVGLVLLSLAAALALLAAVEQGLLGSPAMQIAGAGSAADRLVWYQDRAGPATAEVAMLSVPVWVYRALMLAWALWLALRLLAWLRWGWQAFATPRPWAERPSAAGPAAAAAGREPLSLDL